jgi:hypothetical protein
MEGEREAKGGDWAHADHSMSSGRAPFIALFTARVAPRLRPGARARGNVCTAEERFYAPVGGAFSATPGEHAAPAMAR